MEDHQIEVGLAGWGDQDALYGPGTRAAEKLSEYARHFSIVELDSSFYAIPSPERMLGWCELTPERFGFMVKAYQGMTGHSRGKHPYTSTKEMFHVFRQSVEALQEAGKLRTVLFQYPPWFHCDRRNVDILKRTREWMEGLPVALEFRHQSWFVEPMRERTLAFMREEGWIHSICDEPQAGEGSVPTVLVPTQAEATMIRMHGRNESGWSASGQPNWRDVRYLYRYDEQELIEWKEHIQSLLMNTNRCWMIFNNNSGGDAAHNGKQFKRMLGQDDPPLPAEQLTLFD